MKNISDTAAYTVFDHIFSKTVRSLSQVVGLKKITQPFWNRWRASGINDSILFRFLDGVGTIDKWADVASSVVDDEVRRFNLERHTLSKADEVKALRDLSYVCCMAQWGSLPITDARCNVYRQCRDYYIEAEKLALGPQYQRIEIPWAGKTLHANLHTQTESAPLIMIVHGIDSCKEEHLATEISLFEAGYSVLCLDGPGQGEAQLLDKVFWTSDFCKALSAAVDETSTFGGVDATRVGVLGISIGGTWSYEAASFDNRFKAIFDLGACIHTREFLRLPFLIKTRMCQVTGARDHASIADILSKINIEDRALLDRVKCHIRILHGSRDRVVSLADKEALMGKLLEASHEREVSMRVIEGGDHCCTSFFDIVREDAIEFFNRTLK
jgi:dienelactone hydrolase